MKQLLEKAISIIYFVFMIGFVLSIANYDIHDEYAAIMVVADVVAILLIGILLVMFKKKVFEKKKVLGYITLIALLIFGIVARISLINIEYKKPESDYLTFYNNAVSFAKTNSFSYDYYIATFPYLAPYMMVLGCFFKIVGTAYKNVVILNVLLDFLSAGILYLTYFKDDKKLACILSVLWLANPLNIFWCGFCVPVTIVNFFVVLIYCICFKNEEKLLNRKVSVLYSLLLGIILGMANSFRPIFIVFIIAIIMYRIYLTISDKESKKWLVCFGIIILILGYLLSGNVMRRITQSFNKEDFSKTTGWTFYVGLNVNSNGTWNQEDSNKFNEVTLEKNPEETQQYFKEEAKKRFYDNESKNIGLLINKFEVLTSQNGSYSSDYFFFIQKTIQNKYVIFLFRVVTKSLVTVIVLWNLLIVFVKENAKNRVYLMLLVLGLILSHLFVEVSPRYSLHAYIPMFVLMITNLVNMEFVGEKSGENKE